MRVLPHKLGDALTALYWHVRRKRLRARNLLLRASRDLPFAYEVWIARHEHNEQLRCDAPRQIAQWRTTPTFGVLLWGDEATTKQRARTMESLRGQIYPSWSLLDGVEAPLCQRIVTADCDYIVPVRVGDMLSEGALFRLAEALQLHAADVLYGDEDRISADGSRTLPWFKPRWNEELFLALDYLHSAVAIRTPVAAKLCDHGQLTSVAELVLRSATTAGDGAILHVPHIIAHVAALGENAETRQAALNAYLAPRHAEAIRTARNAYRINWPLPSPLPLVSIIVPTKDKLELLVPCIETVLKRTDYPNFEIIIVDNLSVEPATAEYFANVEKNPRIRVLQFAQPYNYSAINNYAAAHAAGAYLCLLNNDTEVIEPKWLSEMMRYAVRPDVGAVGAKLLYEDGSIQHAGVVIGIGGAAGHAHRFEPEGSPGYFAMPHVAQFVSAVTAACLVVAKDKFEGVGGLDENAFAVAFNDVDLCLKLQARGWKNVYTPYAVLTHHESKSRGNDMAPSQINRYRQELAVLQERWGTVDYADPLHNPNLDRSSEQFVIRL